MSDGFATSTPTQRTSCGAGSRGVKADLAARFVAAVENYDGTAPWRLFPIPTLNVESPIEVFDLEVDDGAPVEAGVETHE